MLQNGSFTEGWQTLPAIKEAGNLKNQRPNGWQLAWLNVGDGLYDDPNTKADGIPECLHKLSKQLPKEEQRGGAKALILEGDATYKIFNSAAKFGATLSQTVTGLAPNRPAKLTVPIQVHLHGETDAYGAESGVWVNGQGGWVNGFDMGDRQWYRHVISFTVPDSSEVNIVIRVKSKWTNPKDFFFDGITLEAEAAPGEEDGNTAGNAGDGDTTVAAEQVIHVQVPEGFTLKTSRGSRANVITIDAPPGVTVQKL